MTLRLGDTGDVVAAWRNRMHQVFGGDTGLYARLHGPLAPGRVFGERAQDWQKEYQFRTGQAASFAAATGVVSDDDLIKLGLAYPYRPIWIYSAPGSGVPWNVGPPFDLGEQCKLILHINHQPIGYPIGGYLGLMGGDPGTSYIEVVESEHAELERLLGLNPDVQRAMAARRADPHAVVDVELWFTGYSQSADGMKQALEALFGDGGPYELIRDRINGVVLFGDPAKKAGPTKVGNNPKGRGIAQKRTYPAWLEALVWDIVNETPTPDFYAVVTDKIRPLFYEVFIRAETSLSFAIYVGQIVIPVLLNLLAPGLGGNLSSLMAVPVLAGATGLPANQMSTLVGGVLGSSEEPDPELIKLLSVQGLLTSLPDLIALVGSLGGIAVHGDYYAPKPEFGGRSGLQVGYDIIAGFRR